MHTSAFDIPKSQTKLRGVEHTRRRQMFVPICKPKNKLKLLVEGIQPVRTDCVLVLQENCETNYYDNAMPGWCLLFCKCK